MVEKWTGTQIREWFDKFDIEGYRQRFEEIRTAIENGGNPFDIAEAAGVDSAALEIIQQGIDDPIGYLESKYPDIKKYPDYFEKLKEVASDPSAWNEMLVTKALNTVQYDKLKTIVEENDPRKLIEEYKDHPLMKALRSMGRGLPQCLHQSCGL